MDILVISDDKALREKISEYLKKKNCRVRSALSAGEAVRAIGVKLPDAAVCGGSFSDEDFISGFVRKLKRPVLVIADRERDAVSIFDSGADDILKDPVDLSELFSRLKALVRRFNIVRDSSLDGVSVDPCSRTVRSEGQTLNLPRKEYKLLCALLSKPGHVFSRDELLTDAWGTECSSGERTVDVHVKRLREKIGGLGRFIISTVRGKGYKIEYVNQAL